MEDINANKDTLDENSTNPIESTSPKDIPFNENVNDNSILNDIKNGDEIQSCVDNDNVVEISNEPVLEWYQFYRSKPKRQENVSYMNIGTSILFVLIILLCISVFIACMIIDFNNPPDFSNTANSSQESENIDNSDINKDSSSIEYNFTPNNDGANVQQYEPPTRTDTTYINDDGTYTVAGVAKYAGDSIIAIYVSTDGKTLNGMGSGIVFSEEGYVLTNAHVIEGSNYIIGILPDETRINLSFVGMNSELDIAVLQSDNKDIPVATMGNSDSVILGEDVVAIGNPAGLSGTVTKGIVSSINRTYQTSDEIERSYIQTDTAISPGNSGGALLNMYGQVIGITSLKITEDITYEGLGFAICINDALDCADTLIKNRFRIGIVFNLENDEIEISEIDETCSIASTELQKGDVITQINGIDVHDYSSVMSALEGSKPSDTVTAKVERRSKDGLRNEFYIEFQLMPY